MAGQSIPCQEQKAYISIYNMLRDILRIAFRNNVFKSRPRSGSKGYLSDTICCFMDKYRSNKLVTVINPSK